MLRKNKCFLKTKSYKYILLSKRFQCMELLRPEFIFLIAQYHQCPCQFFQVKFEIIKQYAYHLNGIGVESSSAVAALCIYSRQIDYNR